MATVYKTVLPEIMGGVELAFNENLHSRSKAPGISVRILNYSYRYIQRAIKYYDSRDIKQNNFDLLRLLFSFGVVYAHCLVLSGTKERLLPFNYSVDTAVQGFFLISGYLIFSSYEKSSALRSYFSKRVRRIYPAYFFVIFAAAFGLYFVSQETSTGYFGLGWLKYLVSNLTFLNFAAPTLPGVFTENPTPGVNGSLWTIKVEVAFYIAVPAIAFLMRRSRSRLAAFVVLYLSSYLYYLFFRSLAETTGHGIYEELARQLPGQLRYFLLGAAAYYYDGTVRKYLGLAGIIALIVSCFFVTENLWFWKPILLACMVFAVAFGPLLPNVGRIGDLSYAAYLFHYPIIQLAVGAGMFDTSPKLTIIAIFIVVTILAYISWHLLEKPFLAKSSHYVRAEAGAKVSSQQG
jgi:peptidoglycan/LPS O-acetylase OafA/YrhL